MLTTWGASIYTERFTPEVPGDGLSTTRGIYVAAQKRFWLDDFYHKFCVGRSVRLGQRLAAFDREAIDQITGILRGDTPAVFVRMSEDQLEIITKYDVVHVIAAMSESSSKPEPVTAS